MNDNTNRFIGYAINDLLNHNVSITLRSKKYLRDITDGWFSSDKKLKFVCNLGDCKDLRISIFLHEYSHFIQWKTKSHYWIGEEYNNAYQEYFEFKGIENQLKYQHLIQEVEQDCDKIAVNLIKKHMLDIDIDQYIRESNWYIWMYNIVSELNKWPNMRYINMQEMCNICPKKFIEKSRYNRLPAKFLHQIDKTLLIKSKN